MGATKAFSVQGDRKATMTFMEHIQELRSRLFWVAAIFMVGATAAYPFVDRFIDILVAPLGDQQLFYLTPIGGFGFIIKVCTYVGFLVAIPALVYQMYRYLEPVMGDAGRSVVRYTVFSTLLALLGILFAYFISLPSALHFLTNFGIEHITAMLTADAYMSFVTAYLLGAAVLFQVPLVLMIFNNIRPLPPRKLMSFQRYVVVGAFIIAAIITPTPDPINQAILAVPIILMYQFGIGLVWLANRTRQKQEEQPHPVYEYQPPESMDIPNELLRSLGEGNTAPASPQTPATVPPSPSTSAPTPHTAVRSIDSVSFSPTTRRATPPVARAVPSRPRVVVPTVSVSRLSAEPSRLSVSPNRSVDGFMPRRAFNT
jgi:sec-independent protein translocase protein TatC